MQDQLARAQSSFCKGELGAEVSHLSSELDSARLEVESMEWKIARVQVVVALARAWAPDATPEETCSGFRLLMESQAENCRLYTKTVSLCYKLEELERQNPPMSGSSCTGAGDASAS